MPCTYYTPAEERAMAQAEANDAKKKLKEAAEELNRTTRLLCTACRKMDEKELAANKELAAWWKEHKKRDDARLAREAAEREKRAKRKADAKAKAELLKKLTKEERRLLGV